MSLVAVKQSLVRGQVQKLRGAGRQLGGSGRLAAGRGRLQQRRVRAHFLDVDVRGVEEDVVFAAERREDGGDPGNQLRKGGATLGFGMPALHHHRVKSVGAELRLQKSPSLKQKDRDVEGVDV